MEVMDSSSDSDDEASSLKTFIPDCFKELAIAVAAFYSPTELKLIQLLINFGCLDELDVREKLSMDRVLLLKTVSFLKVDRIILERIIRSKRGKLTKGFCYHINYKSLTDIVKYKFMHIENKIKMLTATKEKDLFKCTACPFTFTEMDAAQLFDTEKNDYYCTHCHNLVQENTEEEMTSSTASVADFVTRTAEIERLLKQCDTFELDPKLFSPEPHKFQEEDLTVTCPDENAD